MKEKTDVSTNVRRTKVEKRECTITIKLTKAEKEVVDARAKLLNQKSAAYARSVLLADLNTDINCSRAKKPQQYVNLVTAINNISDDKERKNVNKRMEEFVV